MFISQIIGIIGNSRKSFSLLHFFWSEISTLLHLVGLRPRVYYTLTNFRGGGGGQGPLAPPPPIRHWYVRMYYLLLDVSVSLPVLFFLYRSFSQGHHAKWFPRFVLVFAQYHC